MDCATAKIELTSIGLRLRDARISKGYGLEELAIATGLTVAEIVAVEDDDHHPLARNVERIEHALR